MKALSAVKIVIKFVKPTHLGTSNKLKYVKDNTIPIITGIVMKTKKANT
jgi:hypothetical protein